VEDVGGVLLNKRIISVAATIAIILAVNTVVLATPYDDQINQQNGVINEQASSQKDLQNKINASLDKRKAIQSSIYQLDSQIGVMITQLNGIKASIATTQVNIVATEGQLKTAEEGIVTEQKLYDERMKAMYKNGSPGYVEILLDSNGLSNFLDKLGIVKSLIQYDNQLIADLNVKKEDINKKKTTLDGQNAELVSLKTTSETKLSALSSSQAYQSQLITQYKAQESQYSVQIAASKAKVQAAQSSIEKIYASMPKVDNSRGLTPATSNAVVAYAYNFVLQGCPYVWGGNGELLTTSYINQIINNMGWRYEGNGIADAAAFLSKYIGHKSFDCSGFVIYVYDHFGISFNGRRTTETMNGVGTYVAKENLQPGDVIYFGDQRDVHHVALYAGNGVVIQAPFSGEVVSLAALDDFSDYYVARRMIN